MPNTFSYFGTDRKLNEYCNASAYYIAVVHHVPQQHGFQFIFEILVAFFMALSLTSVNVCCFQNFKLSSTGCIYKLRGKN